MDNNNFLLPLLLVVGGGGLLYYVSQQQPDGRTYIPAGGSWGGYRNNNNTGVYLDAAGRIVDALGNLIGNITDIINATNSPDNEWTDEEWDAFIEEDDYWAQDMVRPPLAAPGSNGYAEVTVIDKNQPANSNRLKIA